MNTRRLHILQHSLGLDQHGRGAAYRNHYCHAVADDPADTTRQDLKALEAAGLMELGGTINGGKDGLWRVTTAGRSAVRRESPAPPKRTRGQTRYAQWLDSGCQFPFGEWLRRRHYNPQTESNL